jgi:hypothetical protein
MRRGTWLQAYVGASALAFASGAAAQGRGPGPFAGSFSVASNTTVSVTSPMAITEERTTRERLEIGQGSRADASIQVTNDLGEHCTLSANRSGAAGLAFGSGQHCTFTDSVRNMRMNFTLRSGTGSISGDSLNLNFSWSVSSDGGFLSIAGSAAQRSSGRRTGGHAVADQNATPSVEVPTPVLAVAPSFPAAVVPVAEPPVVPMMPMTGTPARTTSHHPSTAPARPHNPSAAPSPVVTAPVAAAPSPVAPPPATAPATAWGSPSPSAPMPSAPASPAWSPPTDRWNAGPAPSAVGSAAPTWGTPSGRVPIDANTPGSVVLSSGWILGPLYSIASSAVPAVAQVVNGWTNQAPAPAPTVGVPWNASTSPANGAWAPSAGGPGVVLGGSTTAPSQGFGVTVNPSPSRTRAPQGVAPGGPGIVFSASP